MEIKTQIIIISILIVTKQSIVNEQWFDESKRKLFT